MWNYLLLSRTRTIRPTFVYHLYVNNIFCLLDLDVQEAAFPFDSISQSSMLIKLVALGFVKLIKSAECGASAEHPGKTGWHEIPM